MLKTGDNFLENAVDGAMLVCPLCRGHLSFSWVARRRGEVQRAQIQCSSCSSQFKVIARIPILLPRSQFADWTHPFVEMLFGNIRKSVEEVIEEHGAEKIKQLYSKLMKGEYQRPQLVYDRPLDRKLVAEGGARLSKRAVNKHFKRIKNQTDGKEWVTEIIEPVKEVKPRIMLDACSGGGFFLANLLREFTDYEQFFSYDIDYHCAARIEGILRHYEVKGKALSMVADARAQPFQTNFFDVITNNYSFSHILEYSKALRETYRILKPGGRLIVRQGFGMTRWDRTGEYPKGFKVDDLIRIHEYGDVYVDKEGFLESVINQGFIIDKVRDLDNCFIAVCGKPKGFSMSRKTS